MNLQMLYYRIRPLAKLRAEQRQEYAEQGYGKLAVDPAVSFVLATLCGMIGGFFGGFYLWINFGFNPDSSGGAFIFIGGAILMSVISVIAYATWKSRAVFYGLNVFTGFTLIGLVLELVSTIFA